MNELPLSVGRWVVGYVRLLLRAGLVAVLVPPVVVLVVDGGRGVGHTVIIATFACGWAGGWVGGWIDSLLWMVGGALGIQS